MLKCLINGNEYSVVEAARFKSNFNETLDSGSITIAQQTTPIEVEPFDVVTIYSTDSSNIKINERKMCIASCQETQTSLNPPIYQYQIELCSETKLLEGIPLPSLAITRNLFAPRSIYYYLEKYLHEFSPRYDSNADFGAFGYKYAFGHNIFNENESVYSKFNSIECPEMQWNKPTLREVLNDLMMVADCIPVVHNDVIDFMDISQNLGEATTAQKSKINYITRSVSSDDYVSGLRMNVINAINGSLPGGMGVVNYGDANTPIDCTNVIEEIPFKNSEAYLLTTENVRVETTYPIWKLFYCEAIIKFGLTIHAYNAQGNYTTITAGLRHSIKLYSSTVKHIMEYNEWRTKDVYYNPFSAYPDNNLNSDYQNRSLYFVRGDNKILNFNGKTENSFLWIQNQTSIIQLMLNQLLPKRDQYARDYLLSTYGSSYTFIDSSFIRAPDYMDFRFKISYETNADTTFETTKSSMPTNKRVVVDNQSNSYIDVKKQGVLEYLKTNRLGNKIKLINARYDVDEEDIPDISNLINGSVIFSKEILVYENHINANYYATDNYVLKNYFTGVKAKLRSWRLVDNSEAFVREKLIKLFVNSVIPDANSQRADGYILESNKPLDYYISRFKYCAIRFKDSAGHYIPTSQQISYKDNGTYTVDAFIMEFTKRICGNSALFTIKMPENMYAGKYIWYRGDNTTGGAQQKDAKYTDDNGEIVGGIIDFYGSFDSGSDIASYLYPAVQSSRLSDLRARIPFVMYKDVKEIASITIQIEWNDNANDMFLGKK